MNILVLGGCGQQGKVVANDLLRKYSLKTADLNSNADIVCDLSEYKVLKELLPRYDLVVGALPSVCGMTAMLAAIDTCSNYVDMSFMSQDVQSLNGDATSKKAIILHDCGVAPGLSHLVAGRAMHAGAKEIVIYVGGIANDPENDYILTWSANDLVEEYRRPARIVVNGNERTVNVLEGREIINTKVGRLEAFYTDGLRSLLHKSDRVPNMVEKTLRWPGHVDKIKRFIDQPNAAKYLDDAFSSAGRDALIMKIVAKWDGNITKEVELVVENDDGMTAMSRGTALSCSAFAQLVADKKYTMVGITSPEDLASQDLCYKYILDCLAERNIMFDTKYPFMER